MGQLEQKALEGKAKFSQHKSAVQPPPPHKKNLFVCTQFKYRNWLQNILKFFSAELFPESTQTPDLD